jgi:hypothetical protein
MKTITVKTQKDYDSIKKCKEYTVIEIRSTKEIIIKTNPENSQVRAYGSSQVTAYGSSQVTACDSSQVRACDYSTVSILSQDVAILTAVMFSVLMLRCKYTKKIKKDKTVTIVDQNKEIKYTKNIFISMCEKIDKNHVLLYKSVDPKTGCDFKTGKIKYDGIVKPEKWDDNPDVQCGDGLHLSSCPGDALSYNMGKILKCKVHINDFVVFSGDITKVRCKKVEVLKG